LETSHAYIIGLGLEEAAEVRLAGLVKKLHDIGKIAHPDAILRRLEN